MTASCDHQWQIWWRSSSGTQYTCASCSEENHVPWSESERAMIFERMATDRNIHNVYHEFLAATENLVGFDLMEAADAFADKYPDRVMVATVDDDHHATSSLVFITHEGTKTDMFTGEVEPHWFGTTVTYVPQCTGENPIRFFLYPRAVNQVLDILTKLRDKERQYPQD